MSLKDNT